jgi:hypothetical protein
MTTRRKKEARRRKERRRKEGRKKSKEGREARRGREEEGKKQQFLLFSGRAPSNLNLEYLNSIGISETNPWDPLHALCVTVPG